MESRTPTQPQSRALPPRQSRAERQAQTREKLIAVARELFIADGYAATSLDKVAEAAGFSKGAVYSNFSGKEELCMEVIDAIHAELLLGVVEAFSAETDFDGRIEAFSRWARTQLGNPFETALEAEFSAAARNSAYVAEQLRNRHRAITAEISRLLRKVVEEAGHDHETGANLFRTTGYFLERIGVTSLDELPELAPYLPDMDDLEDELAEMVSQPVASEQAPEAPHEHPHSPHSGDGTEPDGGTEPT